MKHILYSIFLIGIILTSCDKDKDKNTIPECNVEDPMQELAWLDDVKNSFTNCSCAISIIQAVYKEKTVFYAAMNDPVCNSVFHVILWDCNGNGIKEYLPGENDTFDNEVTLTKVLYTCSD